MSVKEILPLLKRGEITVLTGAGISVESGIPDFRSAGGLWERFDPMEYATLQAFQQNPSKVWQMLEELDAVIQDARPNAGHRALAEMEAQGLVQGIITQNIDALHQRAGSREVVEIHGGGDRLECLKCSRIYHRDEIEEIPPSCEDCSELLKPMVVLFGEMIPERALQRSFAHSSNCQVMLVVGTSATVAPASNLPIRARRQGATIVEINLERTDLTPFADYSLRGKAGEILPQIWEELKENLDLRN